MTRDATRRARTRSAAATRRSTGTNQIPPKRQDTPRATAAPAARITQPRRWSKSFWVKSAAEEQREQASTRKPALTASEWENETGGCLEGQETEPVGASCGGGSSMRAKQSEQYTETRMQRAYVCTIAKLMAMRPTDRRAL